MDQQVFLRLAKRELGLTYARLADELGVSLRTVEKWAASGSSPDHRAMPVMATRFILMMMDQRKRVHLAAGNRQGAETIDAIAAQVDHRRLAESLRIFGALQRSARRFVARAPAARKPPYFRTLDEKNEWQRDQEIRDARHIAAQAAGRR
jgi:transcriptional regulator with XRE-family HTH domain